VTAGPENGLERSGIDLDRLDRDGALREAASRLPRRDLLLKGLAAAGAAGVALALPRGARAASRSNDASILNYALTLEYLQAAFYTEAERMKALTGGSALAAKQVGSVERAHVSALRKALGSSAVKRPFFDFQGTTEAQKAFLRTAVAFEDLGTAAYKGQLPLITSPEALAAAVAIHTVEARHAAWIRFLAGAPPTSSAFDDPIGRPEAEHLVASTKFIVQRPTTVGRRRPTFTG
jgi:hypothetical protein